MGDHTLTTEEMPSHYHGHTSPGTLNGYGGGAPYNGGAWGEYGASDGWNTASAGGSQSHTHTLTNIATGNASSVPPYYCLSYIMRTM